MRAIQVKLNPPTEYDFSAFTEDSFAEHLKITGTVQLERSIKRLKINKGATNE